MKIVFCNKLNRLWIQHIEELRKDFPQVDFVTEQENMDREIAQATALVGGHFSAETVQQAKDLRMIFVPFAGVNALPLATLKARGIRASNVHGNARYVAERAVAMALCFYGKIIEYHQDLRAARWHGFWAKASIKDTWDSMQGRTCAVVGTGEIGKYIAKYLKVFDCYVIGVKKRPAKEMPAHFDEITLDLHAAIDKSELVFLALPSTNDTAGIISKEILSRMKGKCLVNVGRGDTVDEEGLYKALKQGVLKGAAIDVWYQYPKEGETTAQPSKYPIHELPNIVLSPHLAGFTPQSARLNIEQTIENIRAYLKTGKAVFEVDLEGMY